MIQIIGYPFKLPNIVFAKFLEEVKYKKHFWNKYYSIYNEDYSENSLPSKLWYGYTSYSTLEALSMTNVHKYNTIYSITFGVFNYTGTPDRLKFKQIKDLFNNEILSKIAEEHQDFLKKYKLRWRT